MIKINLLPPNIFEAKVIRNIAVAFGLLAVIIVVGMLYWNNKINTEAAEVQRLADAAKALHDKAESIKGEAESMRSSIAPIQEKIKFFEDVKKHNESYPQLYRELAKFTYAKVVYTNITPSDGGTLQLQGSAPSLSDVGRYMMNIYRATHLFQTVTVSQVTLSSQPAPGQSAASGSPAQLSAPSGFAPPSAAPNQYTAGMNAISVGSERRAAIESVKWSFNVQCTLTEEWKTKITAPTFGGADAAGMPSS